LIPARVCGPIRGLIYTNIMSLAAMDKNNAMALKSTLDVEIN
jgi:hypothetical protein